MEDNKDLAVPETTAVQVSSHDTIIEHAIKNGATMDQIEKFMVLKERHEAYEARKAYHVAMSAFKANAPKIVKDKQVSFSTSKGQTSYKHATLANVTESIGKVLSEHGLSATWSCQQNGGITVTCKITHIMGHSEETSLTAQPDASGSKNSIQQIGSTISYLERYTVLMLTGLATSDQDDDGKKSESVEYINDEQLSTIRDYVDNEGIPEKNLLKYAGVDSLEQIQKSDYDKVMSSIKATMDQRKPSGEVIDVDKS